LELLFFNMMLHYGFVSNIADFTADAVGHGLASLVKIEDTPYWRLREEVVNDYILRTAALRETYDTDKSILLKRIDNICSPEADIGKVTEALVATIFLRAAVLNSTFFPYFKPHLALPFGEYLHQMRFNIKACANSYEVCFAESELDSQDLGSLLKYIKKKCLLLFPSKETKPDLIFYGTVQEDQPPIPCLVQVKGLSAPLSKTGVKSALTSLHPNNFFRERSDRNSKLRKNFMVWWNSKKFFFQRCVRVLFSWGGFTSLAGLDDELNQHNEKYSDQPIVLLEFSAQQHLIGKVIKNTRIANLLDPKGKADSGTSTDWPYLEIATGDQYFAKFKAMKKARKESLNKQNEERQLLKEKSITSRAEARTEKGRRPLKALKRTSAKKVAKNYVSKEEDDDFM